MHGQACKPRMESRTGKGHLPCSFRTFLNPLLLFTLGCTDGSLQRHAEVGFSELDEVGDTSLHLSSQLLRQRLHHLGVCMQDVRRIGLFTWPLRRIACFWKHFAWAEQADISTSVAVELRLRTLSLAGDGRGP